MPRPTSKLELLKASQAGFTAIEYLLEDFTADQLSAQFSFEHRDRCVRDVLGHLYHWHLLFLSWYQEGMAGNIPVMPAEGYSWKTTPQLNAAIFQDCQTVKVNAMRKKLKRTHGKLLELIESHSNNELFIKQHFQWTGSTSLGSYITSATSAHYAWALKLLKRQEKSFQSM